MLKSIHKSLEYYIANFGPYAHKEARIIEFPRVARFAQAFPGTMPYSEAIGFIANLSKPDDIDMVYYVVAHRNGSSMVGSPGGRREHARRDAALGDDGAIFRAHGDGARIRPRYDAQIPGIRNG